MSRYSAATLRARPFPSSTTKQFPPSLVNYEAFCPCYQHIILIRCFGFSKTCFICKFICKEADVDELAGSWHIANRSDSHKGGYYT